MSYCTMACCLAHHRDVYFNLQDHAWVHADGWPCDPMAGCPRPGAWADY
jgi:hypothetical protein